MASDEKSNENKEKDLKRATTIESRDDEAKLSDVFDLFDSLEQFVKTCYDSRYATKNEIYVDKQKHCIIGKFDNTYIMEGFKKKPTVDEKMLQIGMLMI